MLETDAGIDDPLFETSICRAHADIFCNQIDPVLRLNEEPGLVQSAVCGWLVTAEKATQFASRISSILGAPRKGVGQKLLRWYDPEFLLALWPALSPLQRRGLVGDADWIICNATNGVTHIRMGQPTLDAEQHGIASHRSLSSEQLQIANNVSVVSALVLNWRAMCEHENITLPDDAIAQMHHHVLEGQRYGLDSDDLSIYAMTAIQLRNQATKDPEFVEMLTVMNAEGLALRDVLTRLPEAFWRRNQPILPRGDA